MSVKEEPITPSDLQQYYVVKKIVDWCTDGDDNYYYKVKWEPSWEPAANLNACSSLIEEFWTFFYRGACHQSAQVHEMGHRYENSSREQATKEDQVKITLFAG